jgi:hypothetical protein
MTAPGGAKTTVDSSNAPTVAEPIKKTNTAPAKGFSSVQSSVVEEDSNHGLTTALAAAACVVVWLTAACLAANYFADFSLM